MKTRFSWTALVVTAATLMCGPGAARAGSIKGKVSFSGEAPQRRQIQMAADPKCDSLNPGGRLGEMWLVNNGALQNVFVYIKDGLDGKTFPVPAEPVELDQTACMYEPHVAGIMVGQELIVKNGDETLHNVHAVAENSRQFNNAMPIKDMVIKKKFTAPEVMVRFKCDVHPWMSAYLGVLDHPFYAVSGADGTFEIKNVPAGTYTIEAWHEGAGTRTQQVTVTDDGSATADFTFTKAGS